MLDGIIYGLIVAWILAIFNVDNICINVLQPFFTNVKLTTDHYYFAFGVFGLIAGIMSHSNQKKGKVNENQKYKRCRDFFEGSK